ncbi:MAG: hypothetical protein K2P35_15890 [Lachnospiraceae bacterium]|nr:hypothetical protein [Lachnospiraceae bacterium]
MNAQNNTEENQFGKNFWSIPIMLDIALIIAGILAGYSQKDYSVNQKENSHLIGTSYMTMNNEFYKIMSEKSAQESRRKTTKWSCVIRR